MDSKFVLHLGVHKTASTHLQHLIKKNHALLSERGCNFVTIDEIRTNMLPKIRQLKNDKVKKETAFANIRNLLEGYSADCSRVILSDEQLIGSCGDIYFQGGMYPNMDHNLTILSESMYGYEVEEIFISLRSYDTYLASAYCETICHVDFMNFREYTKNISHDEFSWAKLLTRIKAIFPNAKITAWRYEQFGHVEGTVIDRIVGSNVHTEFSSLEKKVTRPSPSHKAITAMRALQGVLGKRELGKLKPALTAAFPKSSDYRSFDPWLPLEKRYLQQAYEKDWKQIVAMENVLVIE